MGRHKKPEFRQAKICDCGGMGFVGLTRGLVALYSPEDHHIVDGRTWAAKFKDGVCYASTNYDRKKTRMLHRELCGLAVGDPRLVDHRNHDGIDNRRENMRVCTHLENCKNKKVKAGKTHPKGVTQYSQNSFAAKIMADGVRHYLGSFPTAEEAAKAYARAAQQLHGEYAHY